MQANVTAPEQVTVELVRADYQGAAGNYRTFFEIFLAICSAVGGAVYSEPQQASGGTWLLIAVTGVAAAVFLRMALRQAKRARDGA